MLNVGSFEAVAAGSGTVLLRVALAGGDAGAVRLVLEHDGARHELAALPGGGDVLAFRAGEDALSPGVRFALLAGGEEVPLPAPRSRAVGAGVAELRRRAELAEQVVEQLTSRLQEARAERDGASRREVEAADVSARRARELSELRAEAEALAVAHAAELRDAGAAVEDLRGRLATAEEDHATALDAANRTLTEERMAREAATARAADLDRRLRAAGETEAEARAQATGLTDELAAERAAAAALRHERDEAIGARDEGARALDAALARTAAAEGRAVELQAALDATASDAEAAGAARAEMAAAVEHAVAERDTTVAAAAETEAALAASRQDTAATLGALDEAMAERDAAVATVHSAEAALAAAREEAGSALAAAHAEAAAAQAELARTRADAEDALVAARAEAAAARAEAEDARAGLAAAHDEIERSRTQLAAGKETVEAWRLHAQELETAARSAIQAATDRAADAEERLVDFQALASALEARLHEAEDELELLAESVRGVAPAPADAGPADDRS